MPKRTTAGWDAMTSRRCTSTALADPFYQTPALAMGNSGATCLSRPARSAKPSLTRAAMPRRSCG